MDPTAVFRGTPAGLQLTFDDGDAAAIGGEFAFFALENNPDVPNGRFAVSATYSEKSRSVEVKGVRWIEQGGVHRLHQLSCDTRRRRAADDEGEGKLAEENASRPVSRVL